MAKLGWIGMGNIGTPMALRLLAAGHDLRVWGRTPERLAPALHKGAREGQSARQLAEDCEAVLLCVTNTAAVEEVLFGPAGIAEARRPELLVIDHSTIHPQRSQAMAERLVAQGAGHLVDAPVTGGEVGARAGTLAVMMGGEAEHVDRAKLWIAAYAGKATHVGPSGSGQAVKSCNQAIASATIMVWAEMLAYARSFGLDVHAMIDALEGGFADSAVRRHHVPRLLSDEFPGPYSALISKDLDIACDIGQAMQTPMPVTTLVTMLYRHHQALREVSGDQSLGLLSLFTRAEGREGSF